MNDVIRIGLIGDYHPDVTAHVAIPQAIALASRELTCSAETEWLQHEAWNTTLSRGFPAMMRSGASLPAHMKAWKERCVRFALRENMLCLSWGHAAGPSTR